jgi:hypothetical protein
MESDVLVAAMITAVGSIAAAVITGATTFVIERIKAGSISPPHRWKWVRRLGYPVAILAVVVATVWVFYLFHDNTASRLAAALPNIPDYKKRIYTQIGLGFVYPAKWEVRGGLGNLDSGLSGFSA